MALQVIYLGYWYDRDMSGPEDLLARHATTQGWSAALNAAGAQVTVLQRFHRDLECRIGEVSFRFVRDNLPARLRRWQVPLRLHRIAAEICSVARGAAVIHFNGLLFPVQLRALRAALPPGCAIVAQHHAERPWRRELRLIQRVGLSAADGFVFAAADAAHPWLDAGLIRPKQRVFEIMEGSNAFRRAEREESRAQTGLCGEPVVLWVGLLTPRKDPLTVLAGFERVLQQLPGARLYMAYSEDALLPQVSARIAGSERLRGAVTLLGRVAHAKLESIYNSADYFVLGSHYEGSGYALAEAMACGVVPVVTDIPSFRMMTGNGAVGATWKPGDADAFAAAMLRAVEKPWREQSERTVRSFEARLSYPAIARAAIMAYQETAAARRGSRP